MKKRVLKEWVQQVLLIIFIGSISFIACIDEIINIWYTGLLIFVIGLLDFIIYKILKKYSDVFE